MKRYVKCMSKKILKAARKVKKLAAGGGDWD